MEKADADGDAGADPPRQGMTQARTDRNSTDRRSDTWLAALTIAATLAAAVLSYAGSDVFARYLGPVPPAAATLIAGAMGYGALASLRRGGWLPCMSRGGGLAVFAKIALLASAFAALTIAMDIAAPYPRDINVPVPAALLFYPAIGFFVDVVFHLVPLALLIAGFTALGLSRHVALPAAFLLAATPEPAFQVIAGFGTGPHWRDLALTLHLFAFGLVQLALLRRHGFAAMLGFRLTYYLHWHILWGTARLTLLF